MPDSNWVTTRQDGGTTVLQIDRPPANAMNVGLLEQLVAAVEALAQAPPSALVITGREQFFSGGADLKAVPDYGPAERRTMINSINRMAIATYGLPCPVVAAVTGHAIAGGLVLALTCDYRVASLNGRYGLTEVKVGVPYPQAAIGVVRAELAPHAARGLTLANRLIDANACVTLGVFDEAIAAEHVLSRATSVARELAALPAAVYARTKNDLRGQALAAMRAASEADPLLESSFGSGPQG
jgi:enoyl-CoA hydratase